MDAHVESVAMSCERWSRIPGSWGDLSLLACAPMHCFYGHGGQGAGE